MKAISHILLLLALLLTACQGSDETAPSAPRALTFRVQTRGPQAAPGAPDDATQFTRLYVAERLQEHDADHLHCPAEWRHALSGGTYSLTDLPGLWYKFAFVCVPRWAGGGGEALLTEEAPAEATCDYNKLLIDYNAAMQYQQTNPSAATVQDMNIYRRVIDRWLAADAANSEDVELTRMTGELDIDMGIPADQFPHPVQTITLTLRAPSARAYIHDQAADRVIPAPQASPADRVYTLDFSALSDEARAAAMKQRQSFRLCLLPQELRGAVTVTFLGTDEARTLAIGPDTEAGETAVQVRKNRITTVLYNGLRPTEFEVRYAGFDTGDDNYVDVDDDVWNDVTP